MFIDVFLLVKYHKISLYKGWIYKGQGQRHQYSFYLNNRKDNKCWCNVICRHLKQNYSKLHKMTQCLLTKYAGWILSWSVWFTILLNSISVAQVQGIHWCISITKISSKQLARLIRLVNSICVDQVKDICWCISNSISNIKLAIRMHGSCWIHLMIYF